MTICIWTHWLTIISNGISILTPFVLLVWFYYSQKHILSKNYYEEINGIYAGFSNPIQKSEHNGKIYAGMILNTCDIDSKGFIKGEINYGEREYWNQGANNQRLHDSIFSFWGQLNHKIYFDRKRHPFKPNKNRIYYGKLYIVSNINFQFDNFKIEDYLLAEYKIIHYRELQSMKFTFIRQYSDNWQALPKTFTLFKSVGFATDPYVEVKKTVFASSSVNHLNSKI